MNSYELEYSLYTFLNQKTIKLQLVSIKFNLFAFKGVDIAFTIPHRHFPHWKCPYCASFPHFYMKEKEDF